MRPDCSQHSLNQPGAPGGLSSTQSGRSTSDRQVAGSNPAALAIFQIIQRHRGSANAISAWGIALELDRTTNARAVRRVIAEESPNWPEIVCARAGDDSGYFIAKTYEEMLAYWAWLDDLRAKAAEKVQRFEALCLRQGFKIPPAEAIESKKAA
jgi:hypothetical protein